MARPLPDVMYGTREGVALDQGAVESVRRLRQPAVNSFTPGPTPAMQPNGSPQAAAFRAEQAARASLRAGGPTPTAPIAPAVSAAPAQPPGTIDLGAKSGASKWVGSTDQWKGSAGGRPGMTSGLPTAPKIGNALRLGGAAAAVPMGVYNGVSGYMEGDTGKAALGAADAAAGVGLLTPAAPLAGAYLGLRGAWEGGKALGESISSRLSEGARDAIGGTVNRMMNFVGGGVDDSAINNLKIDPVLRRPPIVGGQTPTAPGPSIREPFSDARFSAQNGGTYGSGAPDLAGKIIKGTDANGNATYSGSNIKAGADIVDSRGRILNTDDPTNPQSGKTTGVSVAGPGGGGRSPMDIYANTSRINGQISDTARALDAYGPGGGGGINGDVFDNLRTKNPTVPATRAERMAQAELANRAQIAEAQTGATLRGQDITAGTSRANTRDTVGASLRGQDMDYAEKMDSKRLDLAAREAQRRAISSAWQGTTDPGVAAARLAASGYDPASALAVAGGQRASAEASDKNFRNITEAAGATTDKDGKPVLNPALQAVAQNVIANAMPGVRNAAPANQNARLREVQATGSLAAGLQEAQGGSLFQTLGIDKAPPAISALPNMQGASLRERGLGSPFANASRGDYELVQPDGTVAPIKRSRIGQKELDYLESQGVSLRTK